MINLLHFEDSFTLNELKWDTNYFGVTCAKVILHRLLEVHEWAELNTQMSKFQFVSIVNESAEPRNVQLISRDTLAFLADTNIQFLKNIVDVIDKPSSISIHQGLEKNDDIAKIADFRFSKFVEDPGLAVRGGQGVYQKWIESSFDNKDKYYALSTDRAGEINGFLLYSYYDNVCLIELIAVSSKTKKSGIGSLLFKAVEHEAYKSNCSYIKVGTQLRNTEAINFYHKMGCKQVGCNQVFHLWN